MIAGEQLNKSYYYSIIIIIMKITNDYVIQSGVFENIHYLFDV